MSGTQTSPALFLFRNRLKKSGLGDYFLPYIYCEKSLLQKNQTIGLITTKKKEGEDYVYILDDLQMFPKVEEFNVD